jgi:xylitol oxidase
VTGGLTNWAGNVEFAAEQMHRPTSLDELRTLVARSERVRALGTGHSFNRIADTTGALVSVAGLPPTIELDAAGASVTVAAGVRYGVLAVALQRQGRALHNLGSLPHISVAGACATGTHGSGVSHGNLATAVSAMDVVTANGDVVTLTRAADGDRFAGAVVSLGSLGIVTQLTMDVVPTYDVAQHVYEGLPREALDEHFDDILSSAYSVSVFTDWRHRDLRQVWRKHRVGDHPTVAAPQRWLGATLADGPRNPVPGMSPDNCTEQMGVPGPWHERLPHFRLGFTPSSGEELQSEYLLPRVRAVEALRELDQIRDRIATVLQVCEIRTVAADDLWLSPSNEQDTVGVHFTWIKDPGPVLPVLGLVEERLAPLGARPHWGKLFTTAPADVRRLYPRLGDFQHLRHELDVTGKFRNELVDRYLGVPGP